MEQRSLEATVASVPTPQGRQEHTTWRLKGTERMEVRAMGDSKRRRVSGPIRILDSDEEPSQGAPKEPKPEEKVLRISAGRAAAAAGIHQYADVGELFLEFVYQDLGELLLQDAAQVQVEVVSPAQERARLLAKSGSAEELEETVRACAKAQGIEGVDSASAAIAKAVEQAQKDSKLSAEEAQELRRVLELELKLEFGARHEDAALLIYQNRVGQPVHSQQRRVFFAMPGDPVTALSELNKQEPKEKTEGLPAFYLTGFVDGMVDVPLGCESKETLVVEVKHRMGRIKDPPEIYDIVQLGTYCRVLGCQKGHLVQCLRRGPHAELHPELHITTIDFSEGSMHRKGWDETVLPSLYKVAAAVYEVRKDPEKRCKLLAATPEERLEMVAEYCPHLGR